MSRSNQRLVVIGNGMVGHKLLTELANKRATRKWDITVFGEEARPAYDRVALSSFFTGLSADELSLVEPGFFERAAIDVHLGEKLVDIDLEAKVVTSASGRAVAYDKLVFATGSYPFVPPILGRDGRGCFVYRTIDDLIAIRDAAAGKKAGAVVGGGLLGLEAANALVSLGLETHIVEFAPRLMPVQLDDGAGTALRRRVEDLGVIVHTGAETKRIVLDDEGRVERMIFADGTELDVDVVVFSAGIRPRDELARGAGLLLGERGGIVVDERCRTSDKDAYAIGECALACGQIWGLVAPGYAMAQVVADDLTGGDSVFSGADLSTKLKLLGVDVASFGDAHGKTAGAQEIVFKDLVGRVYKKLVLSDDAKRVLGGILVGDATAYGVLLQMMLHRMPVSDHPEELIVPRQGTGAGKPAFGVEAIPEQAIICSCHAVSKQAICKVIADKDLTEVGAVKSCTKAGTGCGGCAPLLGQILQAELKRAGKSVSTALCEHFPHSRQELFDIVRVHGISSFGELIQRHGKGRGCEICKPAAASIFASLTSGYVLEGEQASLQDTNDHFLANMQKDGSYSVVPRVPGGEITPDQLMTIGKVAKQFGLYTKITGGQRIDLFGARVHELPKIWQQLIDAGMESGHAYAKALRTVKSCVGSTWCRFGVQDSVALAIEIELRYRGLRAPHKVKAAVSGCTRECAEAQSKDFGVIATEKGWNLYICGNGGMRPQHAVLFAQDLDKDTLIRYIDRFLMFYVRTADRLERTATWLNRRPGGIEELRKILIDDELGIAAELEAHMARHVESYECEWRATLQNPERMRRFVHFVNSPRADPNVVFVGERGQLRPAGKNEKPDARGAEGRGIEVEGP